MLYNFGKYLQPNKKSSAAFRFDLKRMAGVTSLLFVSGIVYTVLAGSVSKEVTPQDRLAIAMLRADEACKNVREFESQLACARLVQTNVQRLVPDMRCAENGERIEPMNFIERGYGCCFDRARFMAKALRHYGLQTRRVSLHDRSTYGMLAYAIPGITSHASTEVLTAKGWMGVDSNEPFILLKRDGTPVTYRQLRLIPRSELAQSPTPASLYNLPLMVTYGLYSRHGRFHGPDLPAPEINYPDFVRYNFGNAEHQNG